MTVKRFEPKGFLLFLAMLAIGFIFVYALLNLVKNAENGQIVLTSDWISSNLNLIALLGAVLIFWRAIFYLSVEEFKRFRFFFGLSLALEIIFLGFQIIETWPIPTGTSPQNLGRQYQNFILFLHALLVLAGIVVQGRMFAKASRESAYVDAYIYSVNPPNLLKLKLLKWYWTFVLAIWVCVFIVYWSIGI